MIKDPHFIPFGQHEEKTKLSLADIINEGFESSQERNFCVDLECIYVDAMFKNKHIMIKNKTIDYQGQKSTMILIQDVTSFQIVDKALKNTEDLIETNKFISNQLKKPLKIISNVTDKLLDPMNPNRPKINETLKNLRAV